MHLHLKQSLCIFFIFFIVDLAAHQQSLAQAGYTWSGMRGQGLAEADDPRFYQPSHNIPLDFNNPNLSITWGGGLNSAQVQTADLDGDGQEELLAFDRSSQSMLVFAWENGNWKSRQELACHLPSEISNWFILKDYDQDGHKDLFTHTSAGIQVFRFIPSAEGMGSWELAEPYLAYESGERIVNLLVNSTDVPAIEDVDGDGDLDILTYDASGGGGLEYYRNQSMERTGQAEQFLYTLESRRWGGLSECSCGEFAYNAEVCKTKGAGHRVMHAGGKSLLLFDVDADGDFDLLNGFEECEELYFLENKGSNTEPYFNEFQTRLPGSAESLELGFPAAFSVDADQDGRQDLIVTSQLSRNNGLKRDYSQSVWWFTPDASAERGYTLQTKAFLQEHMLDVGEWTVPAFADVDADGDFDMLLGSYGKPETEGFYAGLQLFTNVGNAGSPSFKLTDEDFLQLKKLRLMQLQPQFVDFNKDGSQDLLLFATETESSSRKGYLFLNKAGSTAPFNFKDSRPVEISLPFSSQDNPFFYDVSEDGLPDLLVGKFDGSLSFFENTGTVDAPAFGSELKNYLGFGLDNYRRPLIPSVSDLTGNQQADLLLADGSGQIRFVESLLEVKEGKAEARDLAICEGDETAGWLGRKSWPVAVQLHSDQAPVLVVGNLLGGLWLLKTNEPPATGGGDEFQLSVYPNPLFLPEEAVYVRTNMPAIVRLISVTGQILQEFRVQANTRTTLPLNGLPEGVYVVQGEAPTAKLFRKILLLQ